MQLDSHLSYVIWPGEEAHHARVEVVKLRVVELRESQQEGQEPDDADDHHCLSGSHALLEGVDDGHVPVQRKQKRKVVQNGIAYCTPSNSSRLYSTFIHPLFLFFPVQEFPADEVSFDISSTDHLWICTNLRGVRKNRLPPIRLACSQDTI